MSDVSMTQRSSALGIVALIIAIASGVMAFIPSTAGWAILSSFLAIILGLVATFAGRGRIAGIVGSVIAVVAFVLAIVFSIIYGIFRLIF